jgi:hypothetical protein
MYALHTCLTGIASFMSMSLDSVLELYNPRVMVDVMLYHIQAYTLRICANQPLGIVNHQHHPQYRAGCNVAYSIFSAFCTAWLSPFDMECG